MVIGLGLIAAIAAAATPPHSPGDEYLEKGVAAALEWPAPQVVAGALAIAASARLESFAPKVIELTQVEALAAPAATALGNFRSRPREAVAALISLLKNPEATSAAADSLAEFGPAAVDAVEPLLAALESGSSKSDQSAGASILRALGAIGIRTKDQATRFWRVASAMRADGDILLAIPPAMRPSMAEYLLLSVAAVGDHCLDLREVFSPFVESTRSQRIVKARSLLASPVPIVAGGAAFGYAMLTSGLLGESAQQMQDPPDLERVLFDRWRRFDPKEATCMDLRAGWSNPYALAIAAVGGRHPEWLQTVLAQTKDEEKAVLYFVLAGKLGEAVDLAVKVGVRSGRIGAYTGLASQCRAFLTDDKISSFILDSLGPSSASVRMQFAFDVLEIQSYHHASWVNDALLTFVALANSTKIGRTRPSMRELAIHLLAHAGSLPESGRGILAAHLRGVGFDVDGESKTGAANPVTNSLDSAVSAYLATAPLTERAETVVSRYLDWLLEPQQQKFHPPHEGDAVIARLGIEGWRYRGPRAHEIRLKLLNLYSRVAADHQFASRLRLIGLPMSFFGPAPDAELLQLLEQSYRSADPHEASLRALILGGGKTHVRVWARWLIAGSEEIMPASFHSHSEAEASLDALARALELAPEGPLRNRALARFRHTLDAVEWSALETRYLYRLAAELARIARNDPSRAAPLEALIRATQAKVPSTTLAIVPAGLLAAQLLLWAIVLVAYPRFAAVRSLVWNPWFRKPIALWYLDYVLVHVPFLQRRLLAPFEGIFLAGAEFDDRVFYSDAWLRSGAESAEGLAANRKRWNELLPLAGHAVLIGSSGSGKTILAKKIARNAGRPCVYLRASECQRGPAEVICDRMGGADVRDFALLQALLHAGSLDVVIDGLNEVTPESVEVVRRFVESHAGTNILLTTQPLKVDLPSWTKQYRLLPLDPDQALDFVVMQEPALPVAADPDYEKACKHFVESKTQEGAFNERFSLAVLTSPADLFQLAVLLAQGMRPNLFNLRDAGVQRAEQRYRDLTSGSLFPRGPLSSIAYQGLVSDDSRIQLDDETALDCLSEQRLVLKRQQDKKVEWRWRHESVVTHFAMQLFIPKPPDTASPLWEKHLDEPKFRSVFIGLAWGLEERAAADLRFRIHQHAIRRNDHSLSDAYHVVFYSRFPAQGKAAG